MGYGGRYTDHIADMQRDLITLVEPPASSLPRCPIGTPDEAISSDKWACTDFVDA